ncbi:hypothetical protein KC356_g126 [Hortaea werneckii]|nr:hypothetical protein KC356_g126 [Hortaea werneckii]
MCSYRPVHALVTCATIVQYTGVASHTSLISSTAKYASVGTPTSFGCTSTMTSSGFGVYRLNRSLISKSLALSFGPDCGLRTILMGPYHPPRTELFAPGQRHVVGAVLGTPITYQQSCATDTVRLTMLRVSAVVAGIVAFKRMQQQ